MDQWEACCNEKKDVDKLRLFCHYLDDTLREPFEARPAVQSTSLSACVRQRYNPNTYNEVVGALINSMYFEISKSHINFTLHISSYLEACILQSGQALYLSIETIKIKPIETSRQPNRPCHHQQQSKQSTRLSVSSTRSEPAQNQS